MQNDETHFPRLHRFKDVVDSSRTIILDKDYDIFGKVLRAGSVLRVVGWREVKGAPFLVVTKGSWESLVDLKDVQHLIHNEK
jgi:hypothetical protein